MSTRRNLVLMMVLGTALAIGGAAISTATTHATFCPFQSPSICSPFHLIFQFDGGITPKKLPKHELEAVAVKLEGKISTNDGTQPSALREATIDFDKNTAADGKGLSACGKSELETHNDNAAKRVCRAAIVGSGTARIAISPSQSAPLSLTLFNGGVKDGTTTLFIRSSIAVPTPTPIIATVRLSKVHAGRYGLQAVAKIPPIVGGRGSLLDFSLRVKRLFHYKGTSESYTMARCPDGHPNAEIQSAVFRNEAKFPGVAPTTTLKGTVIRPCIPVEEALPEVRSAGFDKSRI